MKPTKFKGKKMKLSKMLEDFAKECREESKHYLDRARSYPRGTFGRRLFVDLAWSNRVNGRKWKKESTQQK